ncbi:MAG: FAD-dependent oxidoreductase [Desulfobacterales bacterium]|nr:MAG: FAD-dependent oxidoreductase [Desulfobacterales bacterium]
MAKTNSIIIIGSGVIGAFTAYYLQKKGYTVTLLEKDRFGCGASRGNCGLIVPGHILPLNSPGNLIKGLAWMFKKDAPLLIKPRVDPDLCNWLIRFALNCRSKNIMTSAIGRAALLKGAIGLYRAFIAEESLKFDWEILGALHAFCSFDELENYQSVDDFTAQFNIRGNLLKRDDALNMEPALGNNIAGAWFYQQSAQLRPEALMGELRQLLAQKGVEIIEKTKATGFRTKSGRVVAVITDKGELQAGQFVVATGAWTTQLCNALGFRLPIQPGKGYSVTMQRPSDGPSMPCFFEEAKVVATPWANGLRLGGTMEFAGYDAHLTRYRLDALFAAAKRYLHRKAFHEIEEEWCGWRPMTPDGLPIIDRSSRLKNVIIAAGHNMEGISMAPGTGKLVSEMVSGEPPHIDPSPYGIARFHNF